MSVETLYPDENQDGAGRGKTSPSIAFLNVLLAVIWWVGWVFLVLFVLVFLYAGLTFLGVSSFKKSFVETTPFLVLVSSGSVIIVALVFLVIVKQLRKISHTLVTGDPFVPENANRLRTIWIAVAAGEIIRLGSTFAISWLSKNTNTVDLQEPDLRIYVWFMVLAVIILSEVFREGARLRQEQKLTV